MDYPIFWKATTPKMVKMEIAIREVSVYRRMFLLRFFASSCFSLSGSFPASTVTSAEVRMNVICIM